MTRWVVVGIVAGCLAVLAGCAEAKGAAHDLEDAFSVAVRDGDHLRVPDGTLDLAAIGASKQKAISEQIKDIFGDDPKESVEVAFKAKDVIEAGTTNDPQQAVNSALDALDLTEPPDTIRELEDVTERAVSADASGADVAQAAVVYGCLWADSG